MKRLKVGIASYGHYKERTVALARGDRYAAAGAAKIWFTSIESFARILSARNRDLLALIAETRPASMVELAAKTGRAPSNLSRTLRTMERYGLVHFERRRGRERAPRVPYSEIVLDVPLRRRASANGRAAVRRQRSAR
ncbi:MAG: helix-turn-helix domain-containing protein [Xanthobacteraceae bacterium]